MSDDAPIVTAEALTHTYGRETVLEDVSLDVRPGEVTAVVGPNGSGKTTLIRSVVGVQNPTSGRVTYHGPAVTRPVGYLQQRPTFRPGQTVREALTFYASLVGETEADAVDRLEQVGLSEALGRPVEALSGGMTRLLGIAQATVGEPPVVVLDEPASGLDPGMRVRIFEVIEELAAAGAAVLLSSHDLALVERSADTVAVLENGSMARVASPAAFREETNADSLLAAFEATVSGDAATVQVGGEP